ncbi:TPA: hypothetical protein N0F65_004997 [Lagenidium giganteum]|uniref:WRKY19-like zinc finger domain-containing protein n=1 Tax=Lagenidium giganteum TaxID=4803 RepID=A0AAV2ZKA3_9STRA|nr:TPA: hypothetical protein N0F65_004997 [Lagenidium giganteum]
MHAKTSLSFILSDPQTPRHDSEHVRLRLWDLHDARDAVPTVASPAMQASHLQTSNIDVVMLLQGSKYCMLPGCTARAKRLRRCWRHGGSIKCTAPDCPNLSKSRGRCWTHGGGIACSLQDCKRIAISNGFCWAHGGGKRCKVPGCSRAAYQRTRDYCSRHYKSLCGRMMRYIDE